MSESKTPSGRPETTYIDHLFLELSQFTQATTGRELGLLKQLAAVTKQLEELADGLVTQRMRADNLESCCEDISKQRDDLLAAAKLLLEGNNTGRHAAQMRTAIAACGETP